MVWPSDALSIPRMLEDAGSEFPQSQPRATEQGTLISIDAPALYKSVTNSTAMSGCRRKDVIFLRASDSHTGHLRIEGRQAARLSDQKGRMAPPDDAMVTGSAEDDKAVVKVCISLGNGMLGAVYSLSTPLR